MKYVQYIGTKPLKRDELTGLLFAPGQQHPVQERDCARMIRHTDMYIEVAPPVGEGPQPEPGLADALRARRDERDEREAREKEESEAAAYLSVPVNVPAMPAPALRSYAMREFGVNLEGVSE
ncbi:MAG: hypothetical protein ACRD0K_31210, partial [Egibacteraceae bacterium]